MANEYLDKLRAHLEIELRRYFPDMTDFSQDFGDDEPVLILEFRDHGNDRHIEQTSDNANASDADWFVFATDTGHVLTLPLFIEE